MIEGYSEASSNTLIPLLGIHNPRRINRSGSLYVEPKISDFVIEKSEKHQKANSVVFLKDRGILRYMISCGEITEARNHILAKFKPMFEENVKV